MILVATYKRVSRPGQLDHRGVWIVLKRDFYAINWIPVLRLFQVFANPVTIGIFKI